MNRHSVGSGLHVHRERTARVGWAPLGLQGQRQNPSGHSELHFILTSVMRCSFQTCVPVMELIYEQAPQVISVMSSNKIELR